MRVKYAISAMAGTLAITAVLLTGAAKNGIKLPAPFATPSADNHPEVVPRPAAAELKVPSGFKVEEWSSGGYSMPRYLLRAPNGDILLAESGAEARAAAVGGANAADSGGAVYIFPGGNAASRKQLITGLDRPYGMAFYRNFLYVAETESVKRYVYDADARTAVNPQEVVSLKGLSKGHWTRAITFQDDKMFLSIGSGSNVDAGEDERRAAILRFNPDGSGQEIWAAGTRNPVDIHFYPGTTTLWAAVQERDLLGDDLVPDYFTHITPQAFYGWPFAYIGPHEDPRRKGERKDLVKKTIEPDMILGAHVAVLSFDFYQGSMFPARYKGGAFLTLHGSWNRSSRVGQSVVFVPFQNGKPAGQREDFLTGWMVAPESTKVWGRPVGTCEMQDGSLLVSDDGGKKIWRVSYGG